MWNWVLQRKGNFEKKNGWVYSKSDVNYELTGARSLTNLKHKKKKNRKLPIMIKLLKTGDKEENIFKTVKEKRYVKYRGTKIRIMKIHYWTHGREKIVEPHLNLLKEK